MQRAEIPQKGPRLERAGRAEDPWRRGSRGQMGKDVQAGVGSGGSGCAGQAAQPGEPASSDIRR